MRNIYAALFGWEPPDRAEFNKQGAAASQSLRDRRYACLMPADATEEQQRIVGEVFKLIEEGQRYANPRLAELEKQNKVMGATILAAADKV